MELTKEQLKAIFDLGIRYQLTISNLVVSGSFPTDYNEALDYAYRFVIEKERDEECLKCKRFYSGSCAGVPDRKRKELTEGNRCAAFRQYNGNLLDDSKEKEVRKIEKDSYCPGACGISCHMCFESE